MRIESVKNNIKGLRFQKSLSQQQLADKVGCTRQTIISLEKNKYSPSYLLVAKIAAVFDLNTQDIISISLKDD